MHNVFFIMRVYQSYVRMKKVQHEYKIINMIFLPEIKVSMLAVISLDGKIARTASDSLEWGSPEDKQFLKEFLDHSDLSILGRKSFELSQNIMSKRNCVILSRNLPPVDSGMKRTEGSHILSYVNPDLIDFRRWLLRSFRFPKKSISILGGAEVYRYFLSRDWIDEIYLTIEPKIFGTGISLLASELDDLDIELHLLSQSRINDKGTLLLHYSVRSGRN